MEQITVRIPTDTLADLEAEAADADKSRSEHIRDVLESRNEHAETVDRLRAEVDDLRTDVERLENEKRLILQQQEQVDTLAKRNQEHREYWKAPVYKRLAWKLTGVPDDVDA